MPRLPAFACLALLTTLTWSGLASAAGPLTVAGDAPAPPAPTPVAAATRPAGAPAADSAQKPEKVREKIEFAASLHVLSGVALDDGTDGGFLARPALELGVNIGVGDVGVFVGGLPLGVEVVDFGYKRSTAYPAMTVVGVHDDRWLVQVAGGASIAADDSYRDFDDAEQSLPSPRGEVRAGYRFFEEGILELMAHAGVERRLFTDRDDQTRLIVGMSVGIGGR
jgi:hypothetical protein